MSLSSASEAERQADRLRQDLAATIDQLADNLAPSRLASEAMATARERTPEWLKRYWELAQSPVGLAIIGGVAALGVVGGITGRVAVKRRRPMQRLRRR